MPFTKATPAVAPYKALGSELITSLGVGAWMVFFVGFWLEIFVSPIFFQSREKKRACLRSSTWNKGKKILKRPDLVHLVFQPWIWGIDHEFGGSTRVGFRLLYPNNYSKKKGTRFRLLFSGNVLTSFLYNPYKLQPRISSPTSFLAAPELLGWNHFFGVKKSGVMFFKPTADRTWNNGYYLKKHPMVAQFEGTKKILL